TKNLNRLAAAVQRFSDTVVKNGAMRCSHMTFRSSYARDSARQNFCEQVRDAIIESLPRLAYEMGYTKEDVAKLEITVSPPKMLFADDEPPAPAKPPAPPPAKPPVIHVHVPPQEPPVVHVHVPAPPANKGVRRIVTKRDSDGSILEMEERP